MLFCPVIEAPFTLIDYIEEHMKDWKTLTKMICCVQKSVFLNPWDTAGEVIKYVQSGHGIEHEPPAPQAVQSFPRASENNRVFDLPRDMLVSPSEMG